MRYNTFIIWIYVYSHCLFGFCVHRKKFFETDELGLGFGFGFVVKFALQL